MDREVERKLAEAGPRELQTVAQSLVGDESLVVYTSSQFQDSYCSTSSLMTRTMRQSALSVGLQMIQYQEELLIYKVIVLSAKGTWTGWRNRLRNLVAFNKGKF